MKNALQKILLFVFLLTACTPQPGERNSSLPYVVSYTNNYKPWSFNSADRSAKIMALKGEIDQLIVSHAEERKIPGIAYGIVLDGKLIISGATGVIDLEKEIPASPTTAFRIASMSKSFTAMAILKLRDEGKLSLEDPAEKYIPEMKKLKYLTSDAQVIRIFNLLTMSAGFPEDNPWGDRQLDESDEMLLELMKSGAAFSTITASQYEYSNTGYALLGNIISRVSGMPFQQYITKNIFGPLGMEHTYYEIDEVPDNLLVKGYRWEDEQWKDEPMLHDGSYGSMGGIITTIEDFSKYVAFHLSAWPARTDEDRGPIRRSTVREMHQATYPRLNNRSTDYNGQPCSSVVGYGYGLRTTKFCNTIWQVGHGGALPGFGSNYVFYPDYGLGIMAFGNLTYTSPYPLKKLEALIFDKAGLDKRSLPVSDILQSRKEQVAELIQHWDEDLAKKILAENFFLDKDRHHWLASTKDFFTSIGDIEAIGEMKNSNELRGYFNITGNQGTLQVFFTLTPEADPKVQRISIRKTNGE